MKVIFSEKLESFIEKHSDSNKEYDKIKDIKTI